MLVQSPSRVSENATLEPLEIKLPKEVSQQVRLALTGKLREPRTRAQFSFEHSEGTKITVVVARPCERSCSFTATSNRGHKVETVIEARNRRTLEYRKVHSGLKPLLNRPIILLPQAQA